MGFLLGLVCSDTHTCIHMGMDVSLLLWCVDGIGLTWWHARVLYPKWQWDKCLRGRDA